MHAMKARLMGKKGDEAMPFPNLVGWLIVLAAAIAILILIAHAKGVLNVNIPGMFSAGRG